MRKKLFALKERLMVSQLLGGSLVLFAGTMASNFGSYLYHPVMGRMLGPLGYGVLSSIISLTYWLGIPAGVLNLVVVKYTSALKEEKGLESVVDFYNWLHKKLLLFGALFCLTLVLLSSPIASFLHFNSVLPLIFISLAGFLGFFIGINLATFQGFLRFELVSLINILASYLKLLVSIFLVWLGFQVNGAVFSFLAVSTIIFLLSNHFIGRLFGQTKGEKKEISGSQVFGYSLPVLVYTITFTSFCTTDILLARHFLTAQDSGFYAALALLGKIIVFASSPIGSVMFPVVSGRTAKGQDCQKVLKFGFLMVLVVCLVISLAYFLFPGLIIKIPFGDEYLRVAGELKFFAIFLTLFSLCGTMTSYYLASSQTKIINLTLVAAVAQAALIWEFHSSIRQIAMANIFVLGFLLIGLLLPVIRNWSYKVK